MNTIAISSINLSLNLSQKKRKGVRPKRKQQEQKAADRISLVSPVIEKPAKRVDFLPLDIERVQEKEDTAVQQDRQRARKHRESKATEEVAE